MYFNKVSIYLSIYRTNEARIYWEIPVNTSWIQFFVTVQPWGPFLESPETFRVTKVSLYLQQEHVSCFETLQLFFLYFYLKHIKRAGFHSKRIIVLRITFRAR